MTSSNDLSKYQKKTDKQHILDNPDTYIGSVENIESDEFVFIDNKIIKKTTSYNPGLYKLFDEARAQKIHRQQKAEQVPYA